MAHYLLCSSDTWVLKEKLAVLNPGALTTYTLLQLKEQEEVIKVWNIIQNVILNLKNGIFLYFFMFLQ